MEVKCCNCGIIICPNSKNMCRACTLSMSKLFHGINTRTVIESCRGCNRYFSPPHNFRSIGNKSEDLLVFCLSRNKTIRNLNIIDSHFLYTEEHSKTLLIECKISSEGVEHVVLLTFIIRNKQCRECMRRESNQFWNSLVQVRQHPLSRRTFWYLEQLVYSHNAHMKTCNIKDSTNGLDFYFGKKSDAIRFVKFLNNFFGVNNKQSNSLISEDRSNNTVNNKSTFCVHLMPFRSDDLVFINSKEHNGLFIIQKVNSFIYMYDLKTHKTQKLNSKDYFYETNNFTILHRSESLKEYTVVMSSRQNNYSDVTLIDDKDELHEISTHLRLNTDDIVYGYQLSGQNYPGDFEFSENLIIVKKKQKTLFRLKNGESYDREYSFFLSEIVSNKEMFERLAEPVLTAKDQFIEDFKKL